MTEVNLGEMSVEDALAHYGVKGMKWGKSSSRPSESDVNKARSNVNRQRDGIRSQKRSVKSAKRPETVAKRQAKLAELKANLLSDPDRATALRITKGDLAVTAIFAAATGPAAPGLTAANLAAGTAIRVGRRKAAERQVAKSTAKTPASKKLTPSSTDSAVTKKAKKDYNDLTDTDFQRKYSVSKSVYAKRVEKYGDPYMKSPAAKLGKALAGK